MYFFIKIVNKGLCRIFLLKTYIINLNVLILFFNNTVYSAPELQNVIDI